MSCHDPRVPVNEEGPGVGVWISLVLGLVAGGVAAYLGTGIIGFVVVALVVGITMAFLIA